MIDPNREQPGVGSHAVRLSARARRTGEQPISFLMREAVANPQIISLAAGLVDQESLPAEETWESLRELFADPRAARRALQYGTTPGDRRLRELLVEHLERLEGESAERLALDLEQVIVTTGSQQLLELVAEVLLDPGDIVLMGSPEYFVFLGVLESAGARAIGVPMDEQGLIPQALGDTFQQLERRGELERVKLLYCGSYYQNPSGVTLAAERRAQVLELVERWSRHGRIYLLEDAAYRELYFQEPPPPSIRSLDRRGETVLLTQTFSKPFAPGLKTGYCVVPRQLVAPMLQQKGNHDFGSSNFNHQLLVRVLESERYAAHVEQLRRVYREKQAAMLQALDHEFLQAGLPGRWLQPQGGLYVWMIFPETVDTRKGGPLFGAALARSVLYLPGQYCFPAEQLVPGEARLGAPSNTIRLTFGCLPADQLRLGAARLAEAIAQLT